MQQKTVLLLENYGFARTKTLECGMHMLLKFIFLRRRQTLVVLPFSLSEGIFNVSLSGMFVHVDSIAIFFFCMDEDITF